MGSPNHLRSKFLQSIMVLGFHSAVAKITKPTAMVAENGFKQVENSLVSSGQVLG